jgi:formylglycine-generating enzyme required for sulfatase activity
MKIRSDRDTWVYAGGNTPSTVSWYGGFKTLSEDNFGRKVGEGVGSTHKVCSKTPNDIGLCDMSGNVWEWVWDGYGSYSNKRTLTVNPTGNNDNAQRILRGGSWLSTPNELRTSYRMYATRTVIDTMVSNYGSFGIRLVRSSPIVKSMPK